MVTGIICEYNPLHLGHKKQLDLIRAADPDGIIVCLMSGNYVQRGQPAIVDKSARAKAAVMAGADLVLELPITAALSSAEGFAAEGVRILSHFCTHLCFGAETADSHTLMGAANALLSENFPPLLRAQLDKGLSFPAARAAALEEMGIAAVTKPNDILAVEYCKAILAQGSALIPWPIQRGGDYHDETADEENPSATALRKLMLHSGMWLDYVPEAVRDVFRGAKLHTLDAGERAILGKLRTMTDAEFEAIPYGSEGLWRKLMHNARRFANLEDVITATKSKRYTRTRLDRMVMCAYLDISPEMIASPAPYVRLLAFNDKGRSILRKKKEDFPVVNAGETVDHPYWALEKRAGDLYGLFCTEGLEPPAAEENRRVVYVR
ncbi:MAG: nucleotidyltransferase family protein [Oscillospiraceae bacterium]|nr:nucleotidyltransferase family protein [Oscillospiraceae bacterium]